MIDLAIKVKSKLDLECDLTKILSLLESGKIFSFGAGGDGQLGHGDTEVR